MYTRLARYAIGKASAKTKMQLISQNHKEQPVRQKNPFQTANKPASAGFRCSLITHKKARQNKEKLNTNIKYVRQHCHNRVFALTTEMARKYKHRTNLPDPCYERQIMRMHRYLTLRKNTLTFVKPKSIQPAGNKIIVKSFLGDFLLLLAIKPQYLICGPLGAGYSCIH